MVSGPVDWLFELFVVPLDEEEVCDWARAGSARASKNEASRTAFVLTIVFFFPAGYLDAPVPVVHSAGYPVKSSTPVRPGGPAPANKVN